MDPEFIPTPDEIKQACELIQAGWSPEETVRRQIMRPSKIDSDGAAIEKQARASLSYAMARRQRMAKRAG